eukprot:TRINITY_DN25260_c0_g1_i1.p1 TRINITY_DN25260_c0_g1~~TRINITY_DN25260_c0_g1_i1.p1  ORF type:complete len:245 (-),score=63.50 TRINITY_DN25260_c0_g1_i1:2-736(-)
MSRVILVTGANQGIGYEIVRHIAQKGEGHIIYLGSRSTERGAESVAKLEAEGLKGVHLLQIDVTNQASVDAAAAKIAAEHGHLDVLVNNAGIGGLNLEQRADVVKTDIVQQVYDTNVFGVIRTSVAFVPLLKKSTLPIITLVSSGLGSITINTTKESPYYNLPYAAYNSSKTAVNGYITSLAAAFPEAKINSVSPGHISTNINGYSGTENIHDCVEGVIKHVILLNKDAPTGTFLNHDGTPIPW